LFHPLLLSFRKKRPTPFLHPFSLASEDAPKDGIDMTENMPQIENRLDLLAIQMLPNLFIVNHHFLEIPLLRKGLKGGLLHPGISIFPG
jgi:hypothetical protein